MKNKKGYSTGFTWIFGLVTLFGLGVLYIIFNQVFEAHLIPVISGIVDSLPTTGYLTVANKLQIHANIAKYMTFFHTLPYVLFFVVIIYMLVAAVRKEREGEFVG